jgi:hypothetical protein
MVAPVSNRAPTTTEQRRRDEATVGGKTRTTGTPLSNTKGVGEGGKESSHGEGEGDTMNSHHQNPIENWKDGTEPEARRTTTTTIYIALELF